MSKEYEGQFTGKEPQMANMHMKGSFMSLIKRKMQIKSTMRYFLITTSLAYQDRYRQMIDKQIDIIILSYGNLDKPVITASLQQ